MSTFVIGDIHGSYKALLQCFERSRFDPRNDHLIIIGDICDGFPYTRECIDELLTIKNCALIVGNHDAWVLDWALTGKAPAIWTSQGGDRTITSYNGGPMPKEHIAFLRSAKPWIERDGRLFVHGGFDPAVPLADQEAEVVAWDRSLLEKAWHQDAIGRRCRIGLYEDIFIGHTPTQVYGMATPIHVCNVWAIDTGAGWAGKLTIMDVETKEFWQSDPSFELYPGVAGRT